MDRRAGAYLLSVTDTVYIHADIILREWTKIYTETPSKQPQAPNGKRVEKLSESYKKKIRSKRFPGEWKLSRFLFGLNFQALLLKQHQSPNIKKTTVTFHYLRLCSSTFQQEWQPHWSVTDQNERTGIWLLRLSTNDICNVSAEFIFFWLSTNTADKSKTNNE